MRFSICRIVLAAPWRINSRVDRSRKRMRGRKVEALDNVIIRRISVIRMESIANELWIRPYSSPHFSQNRKLRKWVVENCSWNYPCTHTHTHKCSVRIIYLYSYEFGAYGYLHAARHIRSNAVEMVQWPCRAYFHRIRERSVEWYVCVRPKCLRNLVGCMAEIKHSSNINRSQSPVCTICTRGDANKAHKSNEFLYCLLCMKHEYMATINIHSKCTRMGCTAYYIARILWSGQTTRTHMANVRDTSLSLSPLRARDKHNRLANEAARTEWKPSTLKRCERRKWIEIFKHTLQQAIIRISRPLSEFQVFLNIWSRLFLSALASARIAHTRWPISVVLHAS